MLADGTEATMTTGRERRHRHVLWVCSLAVVFFGVRAWYWSLTEEEPFSDMLDYLTIGHRVADSWTFDQSPFWQSYKPPTLPILIAGVVTLFGKSLVAWRIFAAVFVFVGATCAAVMITRATKRSWHGYALLLIVAISRPSIFWSYKVATESIAEGFGYFCIAATLWVFRRPSAIKLAVLGALFAAAMLNRPQTAIVLPLIAGGVFLMRPRGSKLTFARRWLRSAGLSAAFCLGALLLWSPWLVRSYKLYGHVLPLTSQGPYSFLWLLDDVTAEIDGVRVTKSRIALQEEAPQHFANDYEAQAHASRFVKSWLAENGDRYPRLILSRLWSTLSDRRIYLTRVSREDLLPHPVNDLLLDKSVLSMLVGVLGLIVLALRSRSAWVIGVVTMGPWVFGHFFLDYPRIIEPGIPMVLFGVAVILGVLAKFAWRRWGLPYARQELERIDESALPPEAEFPQQ